MDSVHDECPAAHAQPGLFDEFLDRGSSCPCCVDVCIFVENGLEILPFTGVTEVNQRGGQGYRYIGHPSANSLNLYLSSAKLSGPLLRIAFSGQEPSGRVSRSGMVGLG